MRRLLREHHKLWVPHRVGDLQQRDCCVCDWVNHVPNGVGKHCTTS
jgi:hypothetical protein